MPNTDAKIDAGTSVESEAADPAGADGAAGDTTGADPAAAAEASGRPTCPVVLPDSPIELMAVLRATVDRLGGAVWAGETEDALLAAERELEAARRAAEGVDAQLFTEINDRCAYTRDGFCHPITFLAKGLRLGRGEARKRYRRAAKIARLTSMTGRVRWSV